MKNIQLAAQICYCLGGGNLKLSGGGGGGGGEFPPLKALKKTLESVVSSRSINCQ